MDAIYLKLDGIEGESRIKGFENQIKLIAYNHNPTKRESGEARGTYIGGLTLCNDPAVPAQLSGFGIGLRRCFHL